MYTFFLIFGLKHRLWVLVRTTICVLSTNKKNKKNHMKIIILTAVKYLSILHGHVCVMVFSTKLKGTTVLIRKPYQTLQTSNKCYNSQNLHDSACANLFAVIII